MVKRYINNLKNSTKCDDMGFSRIIAFVVSILILIAIGWYIIGEDVFEVVKWQFGGLGFGVIALPLTNRIFGTFKSKGYIFSRILGLVVTGYLTWGLVSIRLFKFSVIACYTVCFLITIAIYYVYGYSYNGKCISTREILVELYSSKQIYAVELSLFAIMLFLTWLGGHRIPGVETERVMDFFLMKSTYETSYFPSIDVWAAGNPINYYYFGHYLMSFYSKLAFVDVEKGYTLALNYTMAFSLVSTYCIGKELFASDSKKNRLCGYVCGVLTSICVCLSGSLHYIIFGKIVPVIKDLLGIAQDKAYYFTNSTRYIGYQPINEADRTITEMPWYTYIVGDLHAHVIDMIVVISILAILLAYVKSVARKSDSNISKARLIASLLNPYLIIIAFLISIASMSNYWDYPIYYVITGSVFLFCNIYVCWNYSAYSSDSRFSFASLCRGLGITVLQGGVALLLINLINMPFALQFKKMESGIELCTTHSMFYQLVVLWGIPAILLGVYILYLILIKNKRVDLINIYILLIALCAFGLVLLPEIIYVKDIYENGFPRANTMFKLTYQAFILFGVAMAYIIVRVLSEEYDKELFTYNYRLHIMKVITTICAALVLWMATYSVYSSKQWYGKVSDATYKGIDSMYSVKSVLGAEADIVDYLKENAVYGDVCVVAPGESYSMNDVIPVMTNCPTILGWKVHEWLWNNDYAFVSARENDISELYTGVDIDTKKMLIEKYDVKYIYVGPREYERYGYIDLANILPLGFVVYSEEEDGFPNVLVKIVE